jgi:hypothetical protein
VVRFDFFTNSTREPVPPAKFANAPGVQQRMRVAVLLSGRAQFSVYYGGALVRWTCEVYRRLQPEIEVKVFGFPTDLETKYPLPHETTEWYRVCLAMSKVPVFRRWEEDVWLRALIGKVRDFDLIHIHNRPQWAPKLRR